MSENMQEKVEKLLRNLKSKKVSVRRMASFELGKLDESALDSLLIFLKQEPADIRVEIIKALGKLFDAVSGSAIVEALGDDSKEVRKTAAIMLGNRKERTGVKALCRALDDKDSDVKKESIWSLFKIKDEEAVEPLSRLLKDNDRLIRARVATVLGELGEKRALGPLVNALQDDDIVRIEAIKALGKLKATDALAPLREIGSMSGNHQVSQEAIAAIQMIEG